MNQRTTMITGILMGGLAVVTGAFGAHALKDLLDSNGYAKTFETAVHYQFYHAFALLATGLLMNRMPSRKLASAAWCFTLGVIFFSGSLYVLSLSGITILGAITPIGGLLFILGWIFMLLGVAKKQDLP